MFWEYTADRKSFSRKSGTISGSKEKPCVTRFYIYRNLKVFSGDILRPTKRRIMAERALKIPRLPGLLLVARSRGYLATVTHFHPSLNSLFGLGFPLRFVGPVVVRGFECSQVVVTHVFVVFRRPQFRCCRPQTRGPPGCFCARHISSFPRHFYQRP